MRIGKESLLSFAAVALALAAPFGLDAAPPSATPSNGAPDALIQLAQDAPSQATLVREGRGLFLRECALCHGREGKGDAGPPLVGNEFLSSGRRVAGQILDGYEDHGMPAFKNSLNDREIAAIATYVRNSWGNSFGIVLPAEVADRRG